MQPSRGIHAPLLLERFFVSAVVAVLVIRAYLQLTGFPQIGGRGLHVAHVLFGGIFMMAALLICLTFLGQPARNAAAILGGAGFGTFIDELGKFLTSDNNYFYQPAIALIYIIFVLIFIAAERLADEANPTPTERLAQTLDVTTTGVIEYFPMSQRDLAMRLLADADPANPLVPALKTALAQIAAQPDQQDGLPERVARRVGNAYAWLTSQRWFLKLVLFMAGAVVIVSLRELTVTFLANADDGTVNAYMDSTTGLLVFVNLIIGVILLAGLFKLRSSVLAAFRWFRRAVLFSLLVAQPLAFYEEQWSALVGLGLNLILLSALEYAISREARDAGAVIPTDA